jgi:hypothetical protein
MSRRQRYSDADKGLALAALDANGGNLKRTGRDLGIPRKTLERWARGPTAERLANLRHQKKGELADRLEQIAHQLLDAITPHKIANATLSEVMPALGIAIDKMVLLRGRPT